MKKLSIIIGLVLGAFVVTLACGAAPPKHQLAAPRRIGLTLSDAGIPIDEAGAPSIYLDSGVPSVLGEPAIDHCIIPAGYINFATCQLDGRVRCGATHEQNIRPVQLTATQCGALFNLLKTQASAQGIQ